MAACCKRKGKNDERRSIKLYNNCFHFFVPLGNFRRGFIIMFMLKVEIPKVIGFMFLSFFSWFSLCFLCVRQCLFLAKKYKYLIFR